MMKRQNLLTTTLLLLALIVGSTSVWAKTVEVCSWKYSSGDSYTTGFTFKAGTTKVPSGKDYYQDSGTAGSAVNSLTLYHATQKLFTTAPEKVILTAKLGAGKVKDPIDNNVYACLVDNTGADIADTEVTLTTKITSKDGSDFEVELSAAKAANAYGVKIYHVKEDSWNVRYYSFTLSEILPDHATNVDDMLINYPTTDAGITASGTSAADQSTKIHTNTDAVTGYILKNGYTTSSALNDNYILLETTGGFKKGDIVSITGVLNYDDSKETKRATAVLFTSEGVGESTKTINKFEDFINGRTSAEDPVEQSYTLTEDYDKLYIGRDGGTNTYLLSIKVARPQSVDVLFTDATWTSFSSDRAVQAPEGVKVYYASASSAGTVTLTEIADRKIPANEGVVLNGSAGVKSLTVIEPVSALVSNLLKPHVKESDAKAAEYYTLAVDGSKNPIFKKSSGAGTLAAGKAYLDLTAAAHELAVTFGDATGVQELKNSRIEALKSYYDMQGRRVAQPTKGLYIVNGKKMAVK